MNNKISNVPQFTDEGSFQGKQADEEVKLENETLSETSADTETPLETQNEEKEVEAKEESNEVTEQSDKQVVGLHSERDRLLAEIRSLREERRGLRKLTPESPMVEAPQKDNSLEDIDPDDINRIERIMKAKGYVRKEDLSQVQIEEAKGEEEQAFFASHPEYDTDDFLFKTLQQKISLFRSPKNRAEVKAMLSLAHEQVLQETRGTKQQTNIEAQKKTLKMAGYGSGNAPVKQANMGRGSRIDPDKLQYLRGFSDEEKAEMNQL